MKIITQPAVQIISAPTFRDHDRYLLPTHPIAAENIIATAGKVCYDSYGVDGNPVEKHIRNLVDSGHHSVLEHVHVGVFIEGISRGCSHEIVRHRMFNYSQRSTRYTAEDDAAIVLDPFYAELYDRDARGDKLTETEDELLAEFLEQCDAAFEAYRLQVNHLSGLAPAHLIGRDQRKWCRGKARQLLPHALETRMVMTGNLRAWRHFFLMRTSRHAEAEIRRLAASLFDVVQPIAPTAFADLYQGYEDGYVELSEREEVAV